MHFVAEGQRTPRKCALCMIVLCELSSSIETHFFRAVRLFANEPVHPEVAAQIKDYLSRIQSDTIDDAIDVVSWAVRSSAIGKIKRLVLLGIERLWNILGEDSEELSAAGQNETILGCVTDDEVLRAVSKCWASLFTYQSVQYRW